MAALHLYRWHPHEAFALWCGIGAGAIFGVQLHRFWLAWRMYRVRHRRWSWLVEEPQLGGTDAVSDKIIDACVFCSIVSGKVSANFITRWPDAVAFLPLNPVVTGHVLVVPVKHVANATEDATVTALTMIRATQIARLSGDCNIITSVGAAATQTVFHLHVHVVPRHVGDKLALPWTNQETFV